MRVREEIIEVLEVQMRRERRCERGRGSTGWLPLRNGGITKTEMRWLLLWVIFCTVVMGATALKIERSPWELNSAAHFHTLAKDDPISSAFFHNTLNEKYFTLLKRWMQQNFNYTSLVFHIWFSQSNVSVAAVDYANNWLAFIIVIV